MGEVFVSGKNCSRLGQNDRKKKKNYIERNIDKKKRLKKEELGRER